MILKQPPPKVKVSEPEKPPAQPNSQKPPAQPNSQRVTSPKRQPTSTDSSLKPSSQSVVQKPTAKVTTVLDKNVENKTDKILEPDKNGLSVEKSSKDATDSEKVENKDQLATPKKERFIPPLPRSSSK